MEKLRKDKGQAQKAPFRSSLHVSGSKCLFFCTSSSCYNDCQVSDTWNVRIWTDASLIRAEMLDINCDRSSCYLTMVTFAGTWMLYCKKRSIEYAFFFFLVCVKTCWLFLWFITRLKLAWPDAFSPLNHTSTDSSNQFLADNLNCSSSEQQMNSSECNLCTAKNGKYYYT